MNWPTAQCHNQPNFGYAYVKFSNTDTDIVLHRNKILTTVAKHRT